MTDAEWKAFAQIGIDAGRLKDEHYAERMDWLIGGQDGPCPVPESPVTWAENVADHLCQITDRAVLYRCLIQALCSARELGSRKGDI